MKTRRLFGVIFAFSLMATLLVPTTPALADHATYEDCKEPTRDACWPDGNAGLSFWFEYEKDRCRFDATIDWGDGTSENMSDVKHLQEVWHQYTSHGVFTVVVDMTGTPTQEGSTCEPKHDVHIIEVPTPENEGGIASASFPLNHRIEKARKQLKSQIDPLLAEYETAADDVVLKERSVLFAAKRHAFLVANVNTIEAQISELQQDLADGIGRADRREMDRLQEFLRLALLEEFAQRLVLGNRQKELERLVLRRDELGAQLLAFVQPLEALDFELTGLTVNAAGKKVYEVDLTSPYSRLFELTRNIRELTGTVEALLQHKKEAFAEFQDRHRAASAKLAEISDLIWENAKKRAAIDFASNACDVMIAGTQGGWAGVVAEVASKVFETALEEVVAEPQGDPNPGKEAIEAWFRETATDVVGTNARSIAAEHGVKDTAGKITKDWIADQLKARWPRLAPDNPPTGDAPSAVPDAVNKSKGMLARIKSIVPSLKTETFRSGFKEWAKSSTGRELLVDAGKAFLKRQLENAEMQAWMEYIQLDVHAQGYFALWQASANAYWEAEDALVAFELEKEQILREFDPATGQLLKVRETFELPATLSVRLVVPRSAKPFEEIPVQVFVGGVQARRTSAKVFEISTEQLTGNQFAIEVR